MASDHQRLILSACKSGNLLELEILFNSLGIKPGAPEILIEYTVCPRINAVSSVPVDGAPATSALVYATIEHCQPAILSFLLTIYPSINFGYAGDLNLAAALEHFPHLPTFKVIYRRNPRILHADEGNYGRSILGQACSSRNPAIPNFLLDQGAYPDYPGSPMRLALSCALQYGQPLALIQRLVACGAKYRTYHILLAMRQSRFDVAEWILRICDFSGAGKDREEWLREDALKEARGSPPRVAFVTRLIVEEQEREEGGDGPLETVVMEKRCKDCGRKAHVRKKGWRRKYWFFGRQPMWPSWERYRREQERYRARREMEKKFGKKSLKCSVEERKRNFYDLRSMLRRWAWEWGI